MEEWNAGIVERWNVEDMECWKNGMI